MTIFKQVTMVIGQCGVCLMKLVTQMLPSQQKQTQEKGKGKSTDPLL